MLTLPRRRSKNTAMFTHIPEEGDIKGKCQLSLTERRIINLLKCVWKTDAKIPYNRSYVRSEYIKSNTQNEFYFKLSATAVIDQ